MNKSKESDSCIHFAERTNAESKESSKRHLLSCIRLLPLPYRIADMHRACTKLSVRSHIKSCQCRELSPRFRHPTTALTTVPSSPCSQGALLNFLSNPLKKKKSQKTFPIGPEILLGQRNVSKKASQSLCDDTQDRRAAAAGWTGTCPEALGRLGGCGFPLHISPVALSGRRMPEDSEDMGPKQPLVQNRVCHLIFQPPDLMSMLLSENSARQLPFYDGSKIGMSFSKANFSLQHN